MDQIFIKTLADVVKLQRQAPAYDQLTFNTQLISDVKNELKSKNETVRHQALLKLYFLAMEGQQIKWAEFEVINLIGCSELKTKLASLQAAHLVIDYQSQGLIMVTNLFKKELKNNYVECSSTLSTIGTISNKELSEQLLDQVSSLITHTKPLIRKKAIAVLGKILTQNPTHIPQTLDKVLQQLKKETNTAVLACGVSLFQQVLRIAPSIYPIFIPVVYELVCKQKSNWILIKLVRISNKLIEKEPRFAKKLIEPYSRLLNQTNSKSLQFELIYTIMKYFKDQQAMHESASDLLKGFLNHSDANLRSLGLECLIQVQSKSVLQFQDQLLESFKKGDYFYRIQILHLFKEYTTSFNFDSVVDYFLDQSDGESTANVVEAIIHIMAKDKFSNVNDPEKLFLVQIPKICTLIDTVENAQKLRDLLIDITIRIPDLQEFANIVFKQILNQFSQQISAIEPKKSDCREIIFKSLIMITGEAVQKLSTENIDEILQYLQTQTIVLSFSNSLFDIDSLIFKLVLQSIKSGIDRTVINQKIAQIYDRLHSISISNTTFFFESMLQQQTELDKFASLPTLQPIHIDAQRLVKRPAELDTPFQIDLDEIQLITQSNTIQTSSQSLDQEQKQEIIENEPPKEEVNQEELQPVEVKVKKVLKVNREEMLPPGITNEDLQKLKDDEV